MNSDQRKGAGRESTPVHVESPSDTGVLVTALVSAVCMAGAGTVVIGTALQATAVAYVMAIGGTLIGIGCGYVVGHGLTVDDDSERGANTDDF